MAERENKVELGEREWERKSEKFQILKKIRSHQTSEFIRNEKNYH